MTSTLYTVDIGFNWNAPPIGTSFSRASKFHPLQWAVVDPATSEPTWPTQMKSGDQLRFHITDITSSPNQNPETVSNTVSSSQEPYRTIMEASFVFGNPSNIAGAYPFSERPSGIFQEDMGKSNLPGLLYDQSDIVFQQNRTESAVYNQANPSWQVARWYVGAGGGDVYTFDAVCFVEISVLLEISDGTTTKDFLFDPEFFVGGTG